MKKLLLVAALLTASCFKPVSVSVGMSYDSFADLCQVTNEERYLNGKTKAMSNTQGTFFTIELENTQARRDKGLDMKGCGGKFTFLNNKLDTIH